MATERAKDFIQSLGVNTHIEYTDGGYADVSDIISDLNYLGIDHVRDGIPNPGAPGIGGEDYQPVAEDGIKFTLYSNTDVSEDLALLDQFAEANPTSIVAIEGPNEVNNYPVTYNGQTGTVGALAFQQALYSAVKSDPLLENLPVYDLTSFPTLDGQSNYANLHIYVDGGQQPYAVLQQTIGEQEGVSGSEPIVITETGYYTYPEAGFVSGVDAETQAKLTLNTIFDSALLGVQETFLYQLLDAYADPNGTDPDNHFGLFDLGNDPKPAALAIHDVTSILADTSANAQSFSTGSLRYAISGLPSAGHSLLLEKSTGVYDLVVWNEPDIWNPSTNQPITVTAQPATVQLGATYDNVEVYDPLIQATPIETLQYVSQVTLALTDHALIIEIDPGTITGVPVIAGTVAEQTTTKEAPVKPFSGVTVTDPNAGASDTLTITLTGTGTLSGTGLVSSGSGVYKLTGMPATITSSLDALTFTPVGGAPNTTTTTSFQLSDSSSALEPSIAIVDSTTSVVDTDPALPGTNLLVDGSFELATGVGSLESLNAGSTLLPDWTVMSGGADIIGTYWQAADGSQSVDLNGGNAAGGISQTFATTAGTSYVADFDMSGSPGDPITTVLGLMASAAGQSQDFYFNTLGDSTSNMGWTNESFDFIANSSTTTLAFTSLQGNWWGPAIDKVSVEATGGSGASPPPAASVPTISGTKAGQTTNAEAPIDPFSSVTIADGNSGATDKLTITVSGAGGSLKGAGLVASGTAGVYTISGSATTLNSELQALVFTPNAGLTNFALSDVSSAGTTSATDTTTSVTDTAASTNPPSSGTNLLVDGSFELATGVGSLESLNAGSTLLPDWTVMSGGADIIGTYWQAADGSQSVDLNGGNAAGGISQTFATTAGTSYVADFDMSGSPGDPIMTVLGLMASAAGQSQDFYFNTLGDSTSNMGWTNESFDFTANSSTTTLAFTSLQGNWWGPAIDKVSVEATGGSGASPPPAASVPTISGTKAGQTTNAEAPIDPFSSVTIADGNSGATDKLTITVSGAGGSLKSAGLVASGTAGVYTISGSATTLNSELQALVFTPNAGLTNFALSDVSSAGTTSATDTTTSVTDTAASTNPPSSGTNLLVDGSFELAIGVGSLESLNAGSTLLPDWTVMSGGADIIGTYWQAADGSQSVDLNGGNAAGGISQTFATTAGTSYVADFDMSGSPGDPITTVLGLMASAAGQSQDFYFNTLGDSTSNMGWTNESFDFIANSSTTTLAFTSLQGNWWGPAIDKVSVEATGGSGASPPPAASVPTISGTKAGQTTNAEAPIDPFSSVTIADGNSGATDKLTITVSGAGGSLKGAGLVASGTAGVYTISGSATTLNSELQALVFTPNAGLTNFALSDVSSAGTTSATDTTTSVTDTAASTNPPSSGTNLLVDGSFELAIGVGSLESLNAGSTLLPDWTVMSGGADIIGTYWQAADGSQSVDLNGGNAAGGISQTFATTAGTSYVADFDMSGSPGDPITTVLGLMASAAGQSQDFYFNTLGDSTSNMGWTNESFDFTANSSTTTLAFTSLQGNWWGPAIDKIGVTAAA